jgi:hypothetical protein
MHITQRSEGKGREGKGTHHKFNNVFGSDERCFFGSFQASTLDELLELILLVAGVAPPIAQDGTFIAQLLIPARSKNYEYRHEIWGERADDKGQGSAAQTYASNEILSLVCCVNIAATTISATRQSTRPLHWPQDFGQVWK